MNDKSSQINDFERLLLEVGQAERAGVYNRTPVDLEGLTTRSPAIATPGWYRWVAAAVPVAACIAILAGVFSVWAPTQRGIEFTGLIGDVAGNSGLPVVQPCSLQSFQKCFTGPRGATVSEQCSCADFDGDGDVDLLDYGNLQMAGPSAH